MNRQTPPPSPVPVTTLEALQRRLDFIRECVEGWDRHGISRPRTILNTADEIAELFCLEKRL